MLEGAAGGAGEVCDGVGVEPDVLGDAQEPGGVPVAAASVAGGGGGGGVPADPLPAGAFGEVGGAVQAPAGRVPVEVPALQGADGAGGVVGEVGQVVRELGGGGGPGVLLAQESQAVQECVEGGGVAVIGGCGRGGRWLGRRGRGGGGRG